MDFVGDSCSICLNSLDGQLIYRTICGHDFHKSCLDQWLRSVDTCPCCRIENPSDGELPLALPAPVGRGLMDLVALGAQDRYLTGQSQGISFWTLRYQQYTNFATEPI